MKIKLFSILMCISTVLTAEESNPAVYRSSHDMLVKTIQTGHIKGVMLGNIAEHFTRELRSTGTLLVEARVVQDLAQTGCKRLEVIYTKKEVMSTQGLTDAIFNIKLDYCLDGRAP